jgi:2-keto-3-deoxy-6-phosphogluconate aldolase
MGSKLFTKDIMANKDYDLLAKKAKELTETIKEIRSQHS